MSFNIRDATLSDIETVSEFQQGIIKAERPLDDSLGPDPLTYYDVETLIKDPNICMAVAEQDQRLIGSGFAEIRASRAERGYDRVAYVGLMFVDPEFRRRGVNNAIMDYLEKWALARDISVMKLEVYVDNDAACGAYEKFGFSMGLAEMRKFIGS